MEDTHGMSTYVSLFLLSLALRPALLRCVAGSIRVFLSCPKRIDLLSLLVFQFWNPIFSHGNPKG